MTIATDILAGMLGGTLMGLIASAHAAILFTSKPPRFIERRIEEGGSANLVTIVIFGLVVLWTLIGIAAAFAADAVIGEKAKLELVPSSEYLVAVVVALVVFGGVAMFFLRDRWVHGVVSLVLAFGIYGFLLPNAVIALQNRT